MDALLKNIMTDDALKQMCDPSFGLTPTMGPRSPAIRGRRRARSTRADRVLCGQLHLQVCRAVGREEGRRKKDTEKIEVETSLVYTAPKANPEGLLFRIKEGKLTSTNPTKGTIFFDSRNGRIASAEISIDLKGDLTVTIGGTDTKVELQPGAEDHDQDRGHQLPAQKSNRARVTSRRGRPGRPRCRFGRRIQLCGSASWELPVNSGATFVRDCREKSCRCRVPRSTSQVTTRFPLQSPHSGRMSSSTAPHTTSSIKAEREPEAAFAVNAWGVRRTCEGLSSRPVSSLVHFSTDYVFGLDANRTTPFGEDDATGPVNVYGLIKLMGEYLVRAECPDALVIRTCGLYGLHGAVAGRAATSSRRCCGSRVRVSRSVL